MTKCKVQESSLKLKLEVKSLMGTTDRKNIFASMQVIFTYYNMDYIHVQCSGNVGGHEKYDLDGQQL